jgi:hypothetical protein
MLRKYSQPPTPHNFEISPDRLVRALGLSPNQDRGTGGVRLVFPMIFMLVYWMLSYLNFEFGLIRHAPLAPITYLYLASCFLCIVIGFAFGATSIGSQRRHAPVRRWAIRLRKPLLALWSLGSLALVIDRVRQGASVSVVITETEFVREELSTSILTTVAAPFAGLCLISLALYFYTILKQIKISLIEHLIVLANMLLLLTNSFLNTNRGSFVHVITWILFLLIFVLGVRLKTLFDLKHFILAKVVVALILLAGAIYIPFISSYRQSEGFLQANYERIERRWEIAHLFPEQRQANGIYLLSSYTTLYFEYIDRVLEAAPLVHFDIRPLFLFWFRQIDRFGTTLYTSYMIEYINRVESLGLFASEWPTLFGVGPLMFGSMLFPIFLFAGFLAFGRLCKQFVVYERPGTLILCFLLFYYWNNSYQGIPADVLIAVPTALAPIFYWLDRFWDK